MNPVDCAELLDDENTCSGSGLCVTKYVWKRISDSINNTVNSLMLSELIAESERINNENKAEITSPDKKKC